MANIIKLPDDCEILNNTLRKCIQSANLNFLIGSGCTCPAIDILGSIENTIQENIDNEMYIEADKLLCEFLKPFVKVSNDLITDSDNSNVTSTLENYTTFIRNISLILAERRNNILPKQASVFTTNYDLFIEKASEQFGLAIKLNDGFDRNPKLNNRFIFSAAEFFNRTYNNGTLYNYQVEIPSINLIKLHGSMSWKRYKGDICFSTAYLRNLCNAHKEIFANDLNDPDFLHDIRHKDIETFNNKFRLVLPKNNKFSDTLLNQVYYDLLRIFANELDKENTLLVAEGFSFADEHILNITQRALRNPTLRLIIFCYDDDSLEGYKEQFNRYNNVDIVYNKDAVLGFTTFNDTLRGILPEEVSEDEHINDDEVEDE